MLYRTIAAIATPLGESSIGVIRISGENAVSIADKVFFPFSGKPLSSLAGYRAAYGEIKQNGKTLDDGVALVFKAPKATRAKTWLKYRFTAAEYFCAIFCALF